ncbi:Hep_Hag repeat-containing protein [Synechococcus sp. WH 8016]|nr:Hep_Hag repeat-containing protein [Synechococcus sp. WH 8016]
MSYDALKCTGVGDGAECYGEGAEASGAATTAIGSGAKSTAVGATSLGNSAVAANIGSTAIGSSARSDDNYATAIGFGSQSKFETSTGSTSSITLGRSDEFGTTDYFLPGLANKPGTDGSTQAGGTQYLTVDSEGMIVAATAEVPPQVNIIAPNFNCIAEGEGATCFGENSVADGDRTSAFGVNAIANGLGATAFGSNSTAGARATALGAFANAAGDNAIAIGGLSNATGVSSLAIGEEAQALGNRSFAFGFQSNASKNDTLALGTGASANYSSSAALGQNVETTRSGQVALGSTNAEITIANLATDSSATDGSQFEMVVANGDGTLSGIQVGDGLTINNGGQLEVNTGGNNIIVNPNGSLSTPNTSVISGTVTATGSDETQLETTKANGTIVTGVWNSANSTSVFAVQANESVVSGGDNIAVASSNDGRVTTYSVSGYNATTQAGAVAGGAASTSNGVTVTSKYDAGTQTTSYGVEVATGNGLTINNGQLEVNTGGNNIIVNPNGSLSTPNTSVISGTVTATGDDETQLTTRKENGTIVTGVWNSANSTSVFAVQANESVVSGGDNIAVASSNDGRVTTYSVSGYNATTQAGAVAGGLLLPVTVSPLPLNTTPELKQRVMALRLQRVMV